VRNRLIGAGVVLGLVLVLALPWMGRHLIARFFPLDHTGVVKRVGMVLKDPQGTGSPRQTRQFAVLFEDGFVCESTDPALSAVKAGDRIKLRGYHDVHGWPVLDPEWWECDEAQLVSVDGTVD
jgi:hypothetical protein